MMINLIKMSDVQGSHYYFFIRFALYNKRTRSLSLRIEIKMKQWHKRKNIKLFSGRFILALLIFLPAPSQNKLKILQENQIAGNSIIM